MRITYANTLGYTVTREGKLEDSGSMAGMARSNAGKILDLEGNAKPMS